jgi:hypothetical protein
MNRIISFAMAILLCLLAAGCDMRVETTDDLNLSAATSEEGADSSSESQADVVQIAEELMQEGKEVFFWYFSEGSEDLEIDPSGEKVEIDGLELYKVGKFQTMAELKAATEDVFTPAFCDMHFYEKISQYTKFAEVDGVLYHNSNVGGMGWNYDLPKEYIVKTAGDNEVVFTALCDGFDLDNWTEDKIEYEFELTIKNIDGEWKLDSFYTFLSDGAVGNMTPRKESFQAKQ